MVILFCTLPFCKNVTNNPSHQYLYIYLVFLNDCVFCYIICHNLLTNTLMINIWFVSKFLPLQTLTNE